MDAEDVLSLHVRALKGRYSNLIASFQRIRTGSMQIAGIASHVDERLRLSSDRLASDNLSPNRLSSKASPYSDFPSYHFSPCPYSDFNGAGFLYFSNFQQIIDRSEHAVTDAQQLWSTASRHLNYYSNINRGDTLRIECLSQAVKNNMLCHRHNIYRTSDGQCIASVVTEKQPVQAHCYEREHAPASYQQH